MSFKCPESIEELEKLERLLPLCRKALYEAAQAKLESGAARTRREAERQLAEETGRPVGTIREYIRREEQAHKLDTLCPPCNPDSQAGPAKMSHDEERMPLKDWFCPECGEIFPAPMQLCHCLRCGAHYPPEDEYCSNCHESLAGMPLTYEVTDKDDEEEDEECEDEAPATTIEKKAERIKKKNPTNVGNPPTPQFSNQINEKQKNQQVSEQATPTPAWRNARGQPRLPDPDAPSTLSAAGIRWYTSSSCWSPLGRACGTG